jgi:hypothetical protein
MTDFKGCYSGNSAKKIFFKKNFLEKLSPLSLHSPNGSIAQLVQSICLTSRGSAVRARVLPQKKVHNVNLFFILNASILFFGRYNKIHWPFTKITP